MARREIELAKLFYTVEARTKGLEEEVNKAQRSFGRLAQFIKDHPVAALGGLAAAAVGVGLKFAEMAEQADASTRRIAAIIPNATAKFDELAKGLDQLSAETGRSLEEVQAIAREVALQGVTGPEELFQRIRVVGRAADATGADLAALAAGLDQVLDLFGLGFDKAEEIAAKLRAASSGRFPITELLDALQGAAPALTEAGIPINDAVNALAHFLEAGLNAKQAGKALKEAAALGAPAVRAIGEGALDAEQALRDFNAAADLVAAGSDRITGQLKERWTTRVRAIGRAINEDILDPLKQLALVLTDPVFEQGNPGFLESSIFQVLSQPLREAAARNAPRDRGGPVLLPGLEVTADSPETAARKAEAARQQAQAFIDGVRRDLAELSPALADNLALVLERFERDFHKVAESLTADERRLAEERLKGLKVQLLALQRFDAQGPLKPVDKLPTVLAPRRDDLQQQRHDVDYIQRQVKQLNDEEEERQRKLERQHRALLDQAATIERAARGLLEMGRAFGLLDDNSAKLAENVADIAANIGLAASGNLSGILAVVGGVSGLLSGIFGGNDADAKRREAILQKNNELLARLAQQVGGLGLLGNIQGSTIAGVQQALQQILRPGQGAIATQGSGLLIQYTLKQLGLSMQDLREVAQGLGITFDKATPSAEELQQVLTAIGDADLTQFAQTFAGQLQLLQLRFDLLDLTNPLDQLEELQKLATGDFGSPVLQRLLSGVDLSTGAGREQARQTLLDILAQLNSGQLTAADLGISTDEFLQLISQLGTLINQVDQQQGTSTGPRQETFGATRGLTEVTGSRLEGALVSIDVHIVEIRDLLAGVLPVGIPGGIFSPQVGPGPVVFEVNVYGALDPAAAQATGATVGAAAAQRFYDDGARLRDRALLAGATQVT